MHKKISFWGFERERETFCGDKVDLFYYFIEIILYFFNVVVLIEIEERRLLTGSRRFLQVYLS